MHQDPPVIRTFNTLPPAWDRSGIFVANLFSLFFGNEHQTQDLCAEVGRLETYGGRLVPILGLIFDGAGPNLVVLEQEPDRRLFAYFTEELGLKLPEMAVLPHHHYESLAKAEKDRASVSSLLDQLSAIPPGWVDGFVTDDSLGYLARKSGHQNLNTQQGSYEGNHKVMLHHHLVACDLPTFTSHLAATRPEIERALVQLRHAGYERAVIKTAIGASGVGLWQLRTDASIADIPEYCFHEGACLVQGWLDDKIADVKRIYSPSVQLFVRPEAVHLYDMTDQILGVDSVHEGNLSPPSWVADDPDTYEELMRQAATVGSWLHGRGYRGTASIDFHVADRTGGREVRVCEVNARVTGATYPALLARHLAPSQAWLMRNLRFDTGILPDELLGLLDDAGILFKPGGSNQVLPINFNVHPAEGVTKGQFLCLSPDIDAALELLERTCVILSATDNFDRD
jgi:carbamoylphosphate synthase large subunit